jgi:hypothetical protein
MQCKKLQPNPLPISRRSTVIVIQAVLLALDHCASKPSQNNSFQWHLLELLPITVAGPRRHCTDFSIMSLRTPVPIFYFFLFLLPMLLTLLYRKHLLLSRVFILTISTFSAKILNHCWYHLLHTCTANKKKKNTMYLYIYLFQRNFIYVSRANFCRRSIL